MTAAAKWVLLGLLMVVAVAAVLFGFRRRRAPVDQGRRGTLAAVRGAFYAAVAVVLGGSACSQGDDDGADEVAGRDDAGGRIEDAGIECYVGPAPDAEDGWTPTDARPEDIGDFSCYRDDSTREDAWTPPDAQPEDAAPESLDDVPDSFDLDSVTCYQIGPDPDAGLSTDAGPDAGGDADDPDALVGLAPLERRRRIRWARRTLERAQAVRRLLSDPHADPTVRAALRADLPTLARHVRLAHRFLRRRPDRRSQVV
ncbi:MAG: hypothetical protein HY905_27180 [Deltaproteobacteria bacterium]|nr:hypothetical protein [Deltaproteobacteria bacterium]